MHIDRVERKPTMNKTVLVIGSVTAEQYKDARLCVLEKGHKPKIIRTTFDEFFLGAGKLIKKYATPEEAYRADEAESDEVRPDLVEELAIRHYSSFGDIGAFVVDQETWRKWDTSYRGKVAWMDNVRMAQTDYAPRWVVSESGKVEYVG